MTTRNKVRSAEPDRKKLASQVVSGLRKEYRDAVCALQHDNPFQLLIATILSAQCTDERVNMVTPKLFERFPTAADMAVASQAELEKLIKTTGFFRNKAKSILACCRRLVDEYGGELPRDIEQFTQLPGVGRKTANVVLGTAFGIASGVVVDTHVQRISRRLGLTREESPEKIERDLMSLLPRKEWIDYSHRLIHHGRRVCKARKPLCEQCSLNPFCLRVGVEDSNG